MTDMFMRVFDGDMEITVESVNEGIFEFNIINHPNNKRIEFRVCKDIAFELQAKLQVMVENAE